MISVLLIVVISFFWNQVTDCQIRSRNEQVGVVTNDDCCRLSSLSNLVQRMDVTWTVLFWQLILSCKPLSQCHLPSPFLVRLWFPRKVGWVVGALEGTSSFPIITHLACFQLSKWWTIDSVYLMESSKQEEVYIWVVKCIQLSDLVILIWPLKPHPSGTHDHSTIELFCRSLQSPTCLRDSLVSSCLSLESTFMLWSSKINIFVFDIISI